MAGAEKNNRNVDCAKTEEGVPEHSLFRFAFW